MGAPPPLSVDIGGNTGCVTPPSRAAEEVAVHQAQRGVRAPGQTSSVEDKAPVLRSNKREGRRRPPQLLSMGDAVVKHWRLRDGLSAWLQRIRRDLMRVEGGRQLSYSEEFIEAPPTPVSFSQLLREARLATVAHLREA